MKVDTKGSTRSLRWHGVAITVADWLTALLLFAWIHSWLFGGMRVDIFGIAVSSRSPSAVLLQAALVATLRHLLVPSPHLFGRIAHWAFTPAGCRSQAAPSQTRSSQVGLVLGILVITRMLVFSAGVLAVYWLPLTGDPSRDLVFAAAKEAPYSTLQSRWDAGWYAGIVVDGYHWDATTGADKRQNVAFFPGFPLVTRMVQAVTDRLAIALDLPGFLGGSPHARAEINGTFVALSAFAVALLLLYRLAAIDLPPSSCRRAVVLCATYPFAYFFSAPYTESLFLMAVVGAFLSVRRGHTGWLLAYGVLAGVTRQTGFLVALPLVVAIVVDAGPLRQRPGLWLGALSPVAGAAAYSGYLWWAHGDPIAWVRAQAAWDPAGRWLHILQASSIREYLTTHPYDVAHLLAVLVMVPLVWASRRVHWSYCVFGALTLAVPLVMDVVPLGRISSIVFPAFIVMAAAPLRPAAFRTLVTVMFLLQLAAAALFYGWRPLY